MGLRRGEDFGLGAAPSAKTTAKSSRKEFGKRLRDYLVRTNLDLLLIGIVLACYHATAVYAKDDNAGDGEETAAHGEDDAGDAGHGAEAHDGEETEHELIEEDHTEVGSLLFPWFAEIVGVFAYYFLSRYAHFIPYTAVMFCVGATIGYAIDYDPHHNAITDSANTWTGINGHVILLVFLPGLIYLDSYNIDVHLFVQSFAQLLTFAFPMVLGGTALTALVAYYLFPYGWPFDLCMTFGSILAATDPVAVAVLLNELGAPPRLKIHVSGESLLNDGSAVVFYNIFSERFFYLIGVEGVGEDIGWGRGFLTFFRLALGGMCIGIAFGIGLLVILYKLNRRLSGEDSVVQVVATITTAYLVFFTAEILAKCSGIIAVVFCGVVVKSFGESMYNDSHMSHHFWEITEYLLNTLLFTLGGCVWGDIVSIFDAKDWGLLFMLFGLVIVIRFFLVIAFYPIIANVGIGTSWKESVFMAYGGLRGTVGIALALALYEETVHFTAASDVDEETRDLYRTYAKKLFGHVGGIALLTLVVNAPTAGPLLKALGLITPTETRKKVVENYRQHMISSVLKEFVGMLTEERFQDTDFTVVKRHVSFFREVTYEQLMAAVRKHKDSTSSSSYTEPNLKNVLPYLVKGDVEGGGDAPLQAKRASLKAQRAKSARAINKRMGGRATVFDMSVHHEDLDSRVQEERLIFIKLLRSSYHHIIDTGELMSRGFLSYALFQSLAYAEDAAGQGQPLIDWVALEVSSNSYVKPCEQLAFRLFSFRKHKNQNFATKADQDFFIVHLRVRLILAFCKAHQLARKVFKEEFSQAGGLSLTEAEKTVLDESKLQVEMAEGALDELAKGDVATAKSLLLCNILLNKAARYFMKLADQGLMSAKEAGGFVEHIEEEIIGVMRANDIENINDMLSERSKVKRMSQIAVGDGLAQGLLGADHLRSDQGS